MILEYNSKTIVVLGISGDVCSMHDTMIAQYWPKKLGEKEKITEGDLELCVTLQSDLDRGGYVKRELEVNMVCGICVHNHHSSCTLFPACIPR